MTLQVTSGGILLQISLSSAKYITLIINNLTRAPTTNQGILKINDFSGGLQKNIMAANNTGKV